ncbi:hypothetical protein [Xylanibacillus composti]|uniref:DUF3887 domain-containing protein n=1 Tax=Xylanibacillus composti TaxID=1572762 RepID=A0A8J4H284_9BACL|nr:hypothetical protein [Xylanibacillus composti]GIQ68052.1 hypothetical protein XYCOK13_08760 [Xylanibacillus composti]
MTILRIAARHYCLLAVAALLLASGCTAGNSETAGPINTVHESREVDDGEAQLKELAAVWAEALQSRDGKPRYDIMSMKAKGKFEEEQIVRGGEDWNYNIGYSSPWVVDYAIEVNDRTATIVYVTQTSEPAYYSTSETLIFAEENGRLVVDDYQINFEDRRG